MPIRLIVVLATAALLGASLMPAGGAAPDPLRHYRWVSRVLIVSAADDADPRLLHQRQTFAAMQAGARERDLVLVEAVGDGRDSRLLRSRFDLDSSRFQAVLVGKDGTAKLVSSEVLGSDRLFPLIDAMPMRQEEMKR